jgi:ribosomal protein S7
VIVSENIESMESETKDTTLESDEEVPKVVAKVVKKRTVKAKKDVSEVIVSENIESIIDGETLEEVPKVLPKVVKKRTVKPKKDQGVAESVGRSKSAIFGRDEVSYENVSEVIVSENIESMESETKDTTLESDEEVPKVVAKTVKKRTVKPKKDVSEVIVSENIESMESETKDTTLESDEEVPKVVAKVVKKRTVKPKKDVSEVIVSENIESMESETKDTTLESDEEVPKVVAKVVKKRTVKPKKDVSEVIVSENIGSIDGETSRDEETKTMNSQENIVDNLNSDELRCPEYQGVAESGGRSKSAIFGRDAVSYENESTSSTYIADNSDNTSGGNADTNGGDIQNSSELRSPEYFTNSYELRSPEFPRTPSAERPEYFTSSIEYAEEDTRDFDDILAESFTYNGTTYFIDEINRIFHPQTLIHIGTFHPETLSVSFLDDTL